MSSIRSLEPPPIHLTDEEDHLAWVFEEAERKQKMEDSRRQEAWELMRYGPKQPREQARALEEAEEEYM